MKALDQYSDRHPQAELKKTVFGEKSIYTGRHIQIVHDPHAQSIEVVKTGQYKPVLILPHHTPYAIVEKLLEAL